MFIRWDCWTLTLHGYILFCYIWSRAIYIGEIYTLVSSTLDILWRWDVNRRSSLQEMMMISSTFLRDLRADQKQFTITHFLLSKRLSCESYKVMSLLIAKYPLSLKRNFSSKNFDRASKREVCIFFFSLTVIWLPFGQFKAILKGEASLTRC